MQKSSRVVLSEDGQPSADTNDTVSATEAQARAMDAGGLLDHLHKAFPAEPTSPVARATPELQAQPVTRPGFVRRNAGKIVKVALAVGVLAIAGWQPVQRLVTSASVEAVVNARIVTLRAPIEGTVTFETQPSAGDRLAAGREIVRVHDPRADSSRADDLKRQVDQVRDERDALAAKLEAATEEMQDSARQVARFQGARVRQLENRQSELKADIRAATANRDENVASRQRAELLAQRNVGSAVQLDRARRDELVSEQIILAAQERLAAVSIELDALREGYFVGDSYNDRPRSLERLQDARQRVAELKAEMQYRDARLARMTEELERERRRVDLQSEARLAAPSDASVWEVLTSPGEQVRRGQDLVRLLECSAPLVTATVNESVYNRLHVGAPARFRLKDSGVDFDGRIVQLSGHAEAASNFAIAPSFLNKEPYRVTVSVPGLAADGTCPIGRTGRVTFPDAGKGADRS